MRDATDLDIEAIRALTPGCGTGLHFNSAGAALMPLPVLKAQTDHLELEARIGGYEAAARADAQVEDTYRAIADYIGGNPREIALLENSTRAWGVVFYGIPFKPGDRILTSRVDYDSNFVAYLQRARQTGVEIEVLSTLPSGEVDVEALDAIADDTVKLIAISHAPTSNGLINPASAIGDIARARGIPYLLDACQTVGHMPINVHEIGCTYLASAGRKFLRGPRGSGFLWVREDAIERTEPAWVDFHAAAWVADNRYELRADARRFESWESNVAARIGLGVAVRYAQALGAEPIWQRIQQLASLMRSEIARIPGFTITDQGIEKSGIVTFSIAGHQPEAVKAALAAEGTAITTATCQSSRLSMVPRGLIDGVLRASVHYYNTEDEIARFAAQLRRLFAQG